MKFEDLLTEGLLDSLHKREDHTFVPGRNTFWCPSVVYTEDMGRELETVFEWIISIVTWETDLKTRGVAEYWGFPIQINGKWEGDCDDFMNAFRLVLEKLGWDEKVLRRIVCFASSDEKPKPDSDEERNYAVMGVSISREGKNELLVFDSRMKKVMSLVKLFRTGYRNFEICSVFHGGDYRRLNIG